MTEREEKLEVEEISHRFGQALSLTSNPQLQEIHGGGFNSAEDRALNKLSIHPGLSNIIEDQEIASEEEEMEEVKAVSERSVDEIIRQCTNVFIRLDQLFNKALEATDLPHESNPADVVDPSHSGKCG